jgi:hypothetical protein
MRKRSRLTLAPVLFVNLRRTVSVPKSQLLGDTPPLQTCGVVSRARFGGDEEATSGSMSEALTFARGGGLDRFSGPGAPSADGSDPPVDGTASGL